MEPRSPRQETTGLRISHVRRSSNPKSLRRSSLTAIMALAMILLSSKSVSYSTKSFGVVLTAASAVKTRSCVFAWISSTAGHRALDRKQRLSRAAPGRLWRRFFGPSSYPAATRPLCEQGIRPLASKQRFESREEEDIDDILHSYDASDRPMPPTLDAQYEDEAFGAFGYQLDEYELEEMKRQERLQQEFFGRTTSATTAPHPEQELEATIDAAAIVERLSLESISISTSQPPPNSPFAAIERQPVPSDSAYPMEGPPCNFDDSPGTLDSFLAKASSGYGATTKADVLQSQLEKLQVEIYQHNKGKEFNVNSPSQVSRVLFGSQGGSTEKSVLEAKAASGNRLAYLILQYRSVKQQLDRLKRKQDNIQQGRQVTSPTAVARVNRTQEHSADPLLLVDASSYIFRAYYSMPPIHRSDGMPTGAVLGFCNMLNKLALNKMLLGETPRLVLVFDCRGKTFRHAIYPDYKSHRPEAPVDLIPQFALVRQAARAYGMCVVEAPAYEADDVIATLARKALQEGLDVNIFSGDKDLMQLVTDPDAMPSIHMIDPASMARTEYQQVLEKWGIPPSQLGDALALAGDTADNVPGVPGIGPKTAAQLLQEFGTLDNLLKNTDRIRQKSRRDKLDAFREQARLSRVLVELRDDVPWELMTVPNGVERVSDLRMEPMDEERMLHFYDAMGFVEIRRRLEQSLRRGSPRTQRKARHPKATVPRPEEYQDVPF